jgi:hypothetical protein
MEVERSQARERQKRFRAKRRGLTLPCCICLSTVQGKLYNLSALTPQNLDLLSDAVGRDLPPSGRACPAHFEPHEGRATTFNPLIVLKEACTVYYTAPSTRKPPTPRLLPPIEPKPDPQPPSPCPMTIRIQELEEELSAAKEKLIEKDKEMKEMADLYVVERGQLVEVTDKISSDWKKSQEITKARMANSNFWNLIGPPYLQSRLWLGIEGPAKLFEEWSPYSTDKWDKTYLFSTFLTWLRRGYTYVFLEAMLGKSEFCFRTHFPKLIKELQPWAKKQIGWPTMEEWRRSHNQKLKEQYPNKLFFWVDGTVIKLFKPKDCKTARVFYNNKHGYHGFVFFVAVSPDGRVTYLSASMAGTEHDKTHWNESSAPKEMEEVYVVTEDGEIFVLCGDKAYKGMRRPIGWKNMVTMTGEKEEEGEGEVNEEEKETWWHQNYDCDAKIARFRAVVERTIGAIKKWLILTNVAFVTRCDYQSFQELLTLIVALTNYQLDHNNTSTW